ncbi:MAG: hypothetical protein GF401_15785 [Chitinivibrionales bacterium]|nr:hypothetical protein [Chitinivibrionales bacterium]
MMKSRDKKRAIRAGMILVCLTGAGIHISAAEPQEIALVVRTRGLVTVSYDIDRKSSDIVTKGYTAVSGARFQTGKRGFAEIVCIGSRSSVILRPDTEADFYFTRDRNRSSEIVKVHSGRVMFDVRTRAGYSFDATAPSTLIWIERGAGFLDVTGAGGESTFYVLTGNAKIADDESGVWHTLGPGSVGYAGTGNRVYTGSISRGQTRTLYGMIELMQKLKGDARVTSRLTIQETDGGTTEPRGEAAALNGAGVEIKAVPEIGISFTHWELISGNAAFLDASQESTSVIVSSNSIIAPQFSQSPAQIEVLSTDGGKVTPSGTITIEKGAPFPLAILPSLGYECTGWKKGRRVGVKQINRDTALVTLSADRGSVTARFIPKQYTIVTGAKKGGRISNKETRTGIYLDTIPLSAQADDGYQFISWSIESGTAQIIKPRKAATRLVIDTSDATVAAHFSDNPYSVVIIDHPQAEITPVDSVFVKRREHLSVVAGVHDGYMLTEWNVASGRASVTGSEQAEINAKSDCIIMPSITEKAFTLTLVAEEGGSVVPSEPIRIIHGTPTIITAQPDNGQQFLNWQIQSGWADIEDPQQDTTPVTLTTSDAMINAIFAARICTVTVGATKGGYTEPGGNIKVPEGGSLTLQAVPNPKAAFIAWKLPENSDDLELSDTIASTEISLSNIRQSMEIEALFSTETVEMTVLTNGLGSTEPDGKEYFVANRWSAVDATPAKGNAFLQWITVSGTEVEFKDPYAAKTEVNPGIDESIIKALFVPGDSLITGGVSGDSFQLTIEFDPARGSIDTDARQAVKAGIPVTVTAAPADGYTFTQWRVTRGSALVSNVQNATTIITLSRDDALIKAEFEQRPITSLKVIFENSSNRTRTLEADFR